MLPRSSRLIQLATKDDVSFDYIDKYREYYDRIGRKINDNKMRVDFHPDQFTVLNSVKSDVIDSSIKNLEYHYKLLDALGIKNKVLVIHVGSSVFGKDNSLKRFINIFNKLPEYLKECIVIENDDKVFNICDVMYLSNVLNVRVVFDYHHYVCNCSDVNYEDIFSKWDVPKIHFSSPRSKKEFRSHSDYINSDEFINFIEMIKKYNIDIDIMIEAKEKDDALFRLVRELKYKTNYKFIDDTTFICD